MNEPNGGKIVARGIEKSFFDGRGNKQVTAIRNLDISVAEKEFAVLLGPSGCGKSTFLYMIAGFEQPTKGAVYLDGSPITRPGSDRGVVFQEYVLFPWKTVLENVRFGLDIQKVGRAEGNERATHYIRLVGLAGFESNYVHTLSGGMQQRVAIARSLAYEPDTLLMDEPFGALDAQTRNYLISDLARIHEETHKTVVFVTHSVQEAISLADKIYLFSARPSTIKAVIDVDMDRPRDPGSARFREIEQLILSQLSDEVERMMREEVT